MKRLPFVLLLHALSFVLFGTVVSANERPRLNVLFICVDDLNHWVSYTGRNPQVKTPNIDRLSRMGVSFTNAYCAAPACEPSRAALFSGLRPSTSGCYRNGHTWKKFIPEGISLNATFKKAGYFVAGRGKTYHNSAVGGLKAVYASEWDLYPPLPKPHGGVNKYEGYFKPLAHDLKDEDLGDWHTVDFCIEQLKKKHDKPFFLACGLVKPHLPWAVPRKYYELFPLDQIQLPPYKKDDLDDVPPIGRKIGVWQDHQKFLQLGRWKNAIQSYLATIAYCDMNIGRLLDALEQSPYRDNTMIVLWGDHGWHLGEKDHWRKFTLWEEATRAPLIWVVPGLTPAGKLCHHAVDFMTIYPTLCDLAGIPIPKHVEGRSIRSLLEHPDGPWDGAAVTTYGYKNHTVRTDRWRYIRYSDGSEELYDHANDPYEWTNLADRPEFAAVKKKLASFLPQKNVPEKPRDKKGKKRKNKKKRRSRKAFNKK